MQRLDAEGDRTFRSMALRCNVLVRRNSEDRLSAKVHHLMASTRGHSDKEDAMTKKDTVRTDNNEEDTVRERTLAEEDIGQETMQSNQGREGLSTPPRTWQR